MAPVANYIGAVRVGSLLFVSGHGPRADGKLVFQGKVGRDLTVEQGYEAAKLVVLNCLGTIKREIGDLDKVERVVKLLAFVNAPEGFRESPKVINGASGLLLHPFREKSPHPP